MGSLDSYGDMAIIRGVQDPLDNRDLSGQSLSLWCLERGNVGLAPVFVG